MPANARFVTAAYFLVMFGCTRLSNRIVHAEQCELLIHYVAGQGAVTLVRRIFAPKSAGE
jgi:hypothetical protein